MVTVRNYRRQDFDLIVRLHAETEAADPCGSPLSSEMLAERMAHPRFKPERNLFVAESAAVVVGLVHVAEELRIRRVVLDGIVHPRGRRKGAATALLVRALAHSAELGAEAAHARASEANTPAQRLLARFGFSPIRRHLELELDLGKCPIGPVVPGNLALRPLAPDEVPALAELQNRSFEGSWGYEPNTPEDVEHRLQCARSPADHVILALESGRPMGFCWTIRHPRGISPAAPSRGRVHMMGVDPGCRNRGVGRSVLVSGLVHLMNLGVRYVELTVDSENFPALSLYRSLGFRSRSTTSWHERMLVRNCPGPPICSGVEDLA